MVLGLVLQMRLPSRLFFTLEALTGKGLVVREVRLSEVPITGE